MTAGLDFGTLALAATRPPEDRPGHPSWRRVDLRPYLDGTYEPLRPTLGTRDDGQPFLYRGRTHWLSGESESAKTWISLTVAAEVLGDGASVLYLDYEDSPDSIAARLLALGTSSDALLERFVYIRPEAALGIADATELLKVAVGCDLAVVDGVTEAMGLQGLKTKDDTDVAEFLNTVTRPLSKAGPAVLVIDHVVKDQESRGRYATGSQHKLSGVDGAAFLAEAVRPFGIGMTGRSRLYCVKDRGGQIRPHCLRGNVPGKDWLSDFILESSSATTAWPRFTAPAENNEPFRPTKLMERVSKALEDADKPLSQRGILDRVNGKRADDVRKAITVLEDEGHLKIEAGPNRSSLHVLVKPFRESARGVSR